MRETGGVSEGSEAEDEDEDNEAAEGAPAREVRLSIADFLEDADKLSDAGFELATQKTVYAFVQKACPRNRLVRSGNLAGSREEGGSWHPWFLQACSTATLLARKRRRAFAGLRAPGALRTHLNELRDTVVAHHAGLGGRQSSVAARALSLILTHPHRPYITPTRPNHAVAPQQSRCAASKRGSPSWSLA